MQLVQNTSMFAAASGIAGPYLPTESVPSYMHTGMRGRGPCTVSGNSKNVCVSSAAGTGGGEEGDGV